MPGRLIKQYREAKGISQSQMADLLHMSQSNYSKIENNRVSLTAEMAKKIVNTLGIRLEDILPDDAVLENALLHERFSEKDISIEQINGLFADHIEQLKMWLAEQLKK